MCDLNKKISIQKISDSPSINTEDYVAVEEPLEIQICSPKKDLSAAKSLSITMRTPGNDHELALTPFARIASMDVFPHTPQLEVV